MATTAELYPIHRARLRGGRVYHRIKKPDNDNWYGTVETACGKTGTLATGRPNTRPGVCPACQKAVTSR
ncbi:hypothetical protein [Streptomyces sp.]|uniref:hypothetical protein n=1 Tax=Streptomyces sp. TaxID=1931 RepID=UPI002F42D6ED